MEWLFIFPVLIYAAALWYIHRVFHQNQCKKLQGNNEVKQVSVLIAARNESQSLGTLLVDLSRQVQPPFEIIVIDDHSEDNTVEVAQQFSLVRVIQNEGYGKKAAITTGVKHANAEIILVTDADCRLGEHWTASLAAPFQQPSVGMVCGPVRLEGRPGLLSELQCMEFQSLIWLGAIFIYKNKPFFCNAACMAFRKELFVRVGGYQGNEHIPSGDDEFLMHQLKTHAQIYFQADTKAMTTTGACLTWSDYIQQRVRWASKHHTYKEWYQKATIYLFGLVNLEVLLWPFLSYGWGLLGVSVILLKIVIDAAFIRGQIHYFNSKIAMVRLPWLVLIYPWLLLRISLQKQYMWKGRQLS